MHITHRRLLRRLLGAGAAASVLAGAGIFAVAGINAELHPVPGQP